ncbi:MAG: hypothetical protein RLZZ301_844 [Bacteroidota bacterium]|jgi:hypothetical protein
MLTRIASLLFYFICLQSFYGQTFQDGDLIFQHSASAQSTAVQQATGSYYSHCGILFYLDGKPFVFEALEPVGVRSLENWIASGENEQFAVYRLKDQNLNEAQLETMKRFLKNQLDKHYDGQFLWSDERFYCSELVYKCYASAGIKLCELKTLSEFNLDSPEVKAIMKQRYQNNIPYDEPMVAPGQISESKLLVRVK